MRRLALLLLTLLPLHAQEPLHSQEPLRVQVNLVNVAFTARDPSGALVSGLTPADIQLSEDAVPQKIAFFSEAREVPLTLGILLDVSSSQDAFIKQHAHDLQLFLQSVLRPQDHAFLLCFGNHLRLASDLTASPADITSRLQQFQHHGGEGMPELGPPEERILGTALFDAVFLSVTERLVSAPGKRTLVIFSDGEDNSSSHDMMETIEEAQRANVLVYTVRYSDHPHGRVTARNHYGTSVMDRFARETGGLAIDAAATDPAAYFRQIGEELRSSYELGYYPTNRTRDDTFRKIALTTSRPGLTLRARTGYFAQKPPTP